VRRGSSPGVGPRRGSRVDRLRQELARRYL
jgi:hypothetical protein